MKNSLYVYQNGELRRKDNTLQFCTVDGEKRDIPINMISEIYLFGEVSINSKLINFLSHNDIIVHFFNYYDFYSASLMPKKSKVSGKVTVKQAQFYLDDEKRLQLAMKFVKGAGKNIYRNLRYYNGRGKDLEEYMNEVNYYLKNLDKARDVQELMGMEGNIHKTYYKSWSTIINQEIDFEKRVKRPPDNIVNTLISYLNSLVYTTVLGEIYKTQLDPTISFLHEPGDRRYSLSLDIAEIFKPLIADRLIFSLLNKNQIQDKHFSQELNYLYMKESGSKVILQEYNKTLQRTIKHKDLSRNVSYRYLIRLECYKLVKHFIGEKEYEPFIIWW